jgi:hypothetical protein
MTFGIPRDAHLQMSERAGEQLHRHHYRPVEGIQQRQRTRLKLRPVKIGQNIKDGEKTQLPLALQKIQNALIPCKAQFHFTQLEFDLPRVENPGVGKGAVVEQKIFQVVHAIQRSFDRFPERLAERGRPAHFVIKEKIANEQPQPLMLNDGFARNVQPPWLYEDQVLVQPNFSLTLEGLAGQTESYQVRRSQLRE